LLPEINKMKASNTFKISKSGFLDESPQMRFNQGGAANGAGAPYIAQKAPPLPPYYPPKYVQPKAPSLLPELGGGLNPYATKINA
jgi:hypothetical protein